MVQKKRIRRQRVRLAAIHAESFRVASSLIQLSAMMATGIFAWAAAGGTSGMMVDSEDEDQMSDSHKDDRGEPEVSSLGNSPSCHTLPFAPDSTSYTCVRARARVQPVLTQPQLTQLPFGGRQQSQ